MIGAPAQHYAGVQCMPSPSQPMVHQTTAVWGSAPVPQSTPMQAPNSMLPYGQSGSMPQSMPMQVPNSMPPYGLPGAVPYQMGPGMMQAPNQNGLPNPGAVNPYRLDGPQ